MCTGQLWQVCNLSDCAAVVICKPRAADSTWQTASDLTSKKGGDMNNMQCHDTVVGCHVCVF